MRNDISCYRNRKYSFGTLGYIKIQLKQLRTIDRVETSYSNFSVPTTEFVCLVLKQRKIKLHQRNLISLIGNGGIEEGQIKGLYLKQIVILEFINRYLLLVSKI